MSPEPSTTLSVIPIPGPEDAVEIAWDGEMARSRGVFGFDSMDARSRSFNLIRARLLELNQKRGWRMFGVVSATPNVGKSFISANVSASLSRDPRFRTYVVDLDLRRGSLSDYFRPRTEMGPRIICRIHRAWMRPRVIGWKRAAADPANGWPDGPTPQNF